jgi:hypothetical protein
MLIRLCNTNILHYLQFHYNMIQYLFYISAMKHEVIALMWCANSSKTGTLHATYCSGRCAQLHKVSL